MAVVNENEMNNDGNEQFICDGLFSVRPLAALLIGLMSERVMVFVGGLKMKATPLFLCIFGGRDVLLNGN